MKWIKFALITVIYLALFNMPYYYYQLMKLFCFVGFLYLAILDHKEQNFVFFWVLFGLLFNPFLKITLKREVWTWIDWAIIFIIMLSFVKKDGTSKETSESIAAILFYCGILGVIHRTIIHFPS